MDKLGVIGKYGAIGQSNYGGLHQLLISLKIINL